jgi:SAM-dependent methyltransferase
MTMVEPLFDSDAITRYRTRALRVNKQDADFLIRHVANEMADRLDFVNQTFEKAAIVSSTAAFVPHDWLLTSRHAKTLFHKSDTNAWLTQNEDHLPHAYNTLDLALSFLTLHEANDLVGALVQIKKTLNPGGLFMGVMLGGDSLFELRQSLMEAELEICGGISPRVYPFTDVKTTGSLLQRANFELPVTDSETLTVRYPDLFALMRDLRHMGAANALISRLKKPTRRAVFIRAAQIYNQKFAAYDGKIPATLTLIWISGWSRGVFG